MFRNNEGIFVHLKFFIMKKLTKNGLAQMAALLPELDEEDQRSILGGTASAPFPADYTGAIPDPIPSVAGMPTATTPSDPYAATGCYTTSTPIATTVETSYAASGCIPTATTSMATSTTTGCYTFEEMSQMMGNGTWEDEMGEGDGGFAFYTGAFMTGIMPSDSSSVNVVSTGDNSNDLEWKEFGKASAVIGFVDELTEGTIEGLGKVGEAFGYIDIAHNAIKLYNKEGDKSSDIIEFSLDLLLSLGGTIGTFVGGAWSVLDYETKDFQEQFKDFVIKMDSGMGKNGDYSFFKFNSGY